MAALADLEDWVAEVDRPGTVWYLKRLSANDTLASAANQAGPYIPKAVLLNHFPDLNRPAFANPDISISTRIDSHSQELAVRAVWYNNRLHGGTRDETRVTGWGGASSPLLDPESTGALTLFAFHRRARDGAAVLRVWLCRNLAEEEIAESRFGVVEAGEAIIHDNDVVLPRQAVMAAVAAGLHAASPCRLSREELPAQWLLDFPTGAEIVAKTCELRPLAGTEPDSRLIKRRHCEYELFQSVEEATEEGLIRAGFATLASFLEQAQRILQRRKARSGRSLELQMLHILREEGFVDRLHFEYGVESEPGRRPDFLFPSQSAYRDPTFPAAKLRMLAAKTTCRDRWRQILNEAERIPVRHLLTLQEGVSEAQFAEMRASGVRLVVPKPLLSSYPAAIRSELLTLADFISEVRPKRPH